MSLSSLVVSLLLLLLVRATKGGGVVDFISSRPVTMLDKICARRAADVREAKARRPLASVLRDAAEWTRRHGPPVDLAARIESSYATTGMAVAAEFKRASPSKGDINVGLVAGEQARRYAGAGAAVLSVLTEPTWFKGTLGDMRSVAEAVRGQKHRPAVLRKDFIIDAYQIAEARGNGADTVLLIVAILAKEKLRELVVFARSLGMEPLVEVNNEQEMQMALEVGARVVGVNNRNLHTFKLDMRTTDRIVRFAEKHGRLRKRGSANGRPGGVVIASLSGIFDAKQVQHAASLGVGCVLVGESLMRAQDPAQAIRRLLTAPSSTTSDIDIADTGPRVKICGVTRVKDALEALRAGADIIGIIMAPSSQRCVKPAEASRIVEAVRAFGERTGRVEFRRPTPDVWKEAPGHVERVGCWFRAWAKALDAACSTCPLTVGVFQDQPVSDVRRMAAAAGVDLVQLHGDEGFARAGLCGIPAISVVHLSPTRAGSSSVVRAQELLERIRPGHAAAILLDSAVAGARGGTGVTFDWDVAAELRRSGVTVWLAGGLHSENVRKAVDATMPWAVDCAGGVEEHSKSNGKGSRRRKDPAKLKDFVLAAKAHGGGDIPEK